MTRQAKLRQIRKISTSRTLKGSDALVKLFEYLALRSLDHPDESVKEYRIATEVLDRRADFDPRVDSTVRVQVARLRAKLIEYYAGEGERDRVEIHIPKGAYHVEFQRRGAAGSAVETIKSELGRRGVLAAAGLVGIGALAGLMFRFPRVESEAGAVAVVDSVVETAESALFWRPFLDGPDPPIVTYSNSPFVGRPETGLRYFDPLRDAREDSFDHYTGVGEVMAVHELGRVFERLGGGFAVKRANLLTWDEAKNRDVIFIGSTSENLPLREIERGMVFHFHRETPLSELTIRRLRPSSERPNEYRADQSRLMKEDHALIRLAPGFTENTRLLILAGLTTFGTQAAAEFVCRTEKIEELAKRLDLKDRETAFPVFEAVLRVKINGGVPVQTEVVEAERTEASEN